MMVPVEGSEETVDVDLVLIAAGFSGSQKYVTDAFKVELDGRTNVKTETGRLQTSRSPDVLRQEICTEASLWWYGQSGKDGKLRKQWMSL